MTLASRLSRVESFRELVIQSEIACAVPEAGTGDSGSDVLAANASRLVLALDLVDQEVLRDDGVALGADDFGDVGNFARPITKTFGLDDDVHGADDHLSNRARGKIVSAHRDQRFQTRQAFARACGVYAAHRAVMTGIHGLQKVKRFRTADFAHDDAFGTHTQTVAYQVAHG